MCFGRNIGSRGAIIYGILWFDGTYTCEQNIKESVLCIRRYFSCLNFEDTHEGTVYEYKKTRRRCDDKALLEPFLIWVSKSSKSLGH